MLSRFAHVHSQTITTYSGGDAKEANIRSGKQLMRFRQLHGSKQTEVECGKKVLRTFI